MLSKWLLPLILLSVFILLAMIMPAGDAGAACRAFLSDLGYETDSRVQAETVRLPENADAAWEGYLRMQRENGFHMEAYAGKTVIKYTFTILNHPAGEPVYANLYWADAGIIGGDIMSPKLDGFMHGLTLDVL